MFVLNVNEEDFDKKFHWVLLYNHNKLLMIHVNLLYEDFQIMDNYSRKNHNYKQVFSF